MGPDPDPVLVRGKEKKQVLQPMEGLIRIPFVCSNEKAEWQNGSNSEEPAV